MCIKGARHKVETIAAIPAVPYGFRFYDFIRNKIIRHVPEFGDDWKANNI